jgi:HK97 family phage major capsid protein
MLRLTPQDLTVDAGKGEVSRRTISGTALTYGEIATVSDGTQVRFEPGSLPIEGKKPKLYMYHDSSMPVGLVIAREVVGNAVLFEAKLSDTVQASEALTLAQDGVLDSVSVGVEPTAYHWDGDVMVITASDWQELSLLPYGAFKSAKVSSVAAAPEEETDIHHKPEDLDNTNNETLKQETEEMSEATAPEVIEASVVTPNYAQPRRETKLPTAAEYIAASFVGGEKFEAVKRQLEFAAPNVTTDSNDGVLPLPLVQPVYNNFLQRRPVIDAIGPKAMPAGGKIFIRPKVTTHTSMAIQSTQNTALQAGEFQIDDLQVTKNTYGGYVQLSEQIQDWSTPEIIGLLLDDMSRIYANVTDNVAADALVAGATITEAFGNDATDPAQWAEFVSNAASEILTSSNGNLPTHIFVSPNMWKYLMGLTDTSGRPLFPNLGPMNAFGSLEPGVDSGIAFGLRVVVDRNFATDTVIVGDASGFEIFEQMKGAISIDSPSTISRTIAWRGYFSTLMIDNTKFIKATF